MQARCSARLLLIFCTALLVGCSQDRPYPGAVGDRADGRLHDDHACAGASIERDLVTAVIPLRLAVQERYAGRRIVCEPLKIVVLLKGGVPLQGRVIQTARGPAKVTYDAGYRYSVRDMQDLANGEFMAKWFPDARGIYVDTTHGRVVVLVNAPSTMKAYQDRAAEAEAELDLPIIVMAIGDARQATPAAIGLEDLE